MKGERGSLAFTLMRRIRRTIASTPAQRARGTVAFTRSQGTQTRAANLVFSSFLLCGLSACEWFTDFKRQPSLWTWEPVRDSVTPSRGNPQNSVPVTGMGVAGFQVSYAPLPGTVDSMSALTNPTPISERSLANGRMYYQINCAVCHGNAGAGDGPATRFGMPAIAITTPVTTARTDGYLYGMIRNGRGLMPPYNRIEELDRWDVVNYVRGLQGRAGRQVAVGPLAAPGMTGSMVPGATRTAPTRQPPFYGPRGAVMPAPLRPGGVQPATQLPMVDTTSGITPGAPTGIPAPGTPVTQTPASGTGAPVTADTTPRVSVPPRR